jgi:hypothetical protein
MFNGCTGKWRASEVGVEDYASGVDHRAQGKRQDARDFPGNMLVQIRWLQRASSRPWVASDQRAEAGEHCPGYFHYQGAIHALDKLRQAWAAQKLVHRRNLPKQRLARVGGRLHRAGISAQARRQSNLRGGGQSKDHIACSAHVRRGAIDVPKAGP